VDYFFYVIVTHAYTMFLWSMNDDVFFRLSQRLMSCIVVALVIWLYFVRIINYYALK